LQISRKELNHAYLTEIYSVNEVNNIMLLDINKVLDPHFEVDYVRASELEIVKGKIIEEALKLMKLKRKSCCSHSLMKILSLLKLLTLTNMTNPLSTMKAKLS